MQVIEGYEPPYMELYRSGALQQRVEEAVATLADCHVCPRNCGVDRLAGATATCRTGRYAWVSSYFAHRGEEDCLRGWNGSGTIFFTMCNLRCVFCQNYDTSQLGKGIEATPQRLAHMMLDLQAQGCHNINFVTPEHVVPQVLEALPIAIEGGLRLPIVYNTSAYDALESLRWMDGIVDIYMPDFKMWDAELARKYLIAKDYPKVARAALREMYRQVGDLRFDRYGIAKRGVLVRHLVMPGQLDQTAHIMRFLAEISPRMYINVMAQYYPTAKVSAEKYPEINRRLSASEFAEARRIARQAGLNRLDERRPRRPGITWNDPHLT